MHIVGAEGLTVDRIRAGDGTLRVNTWYAGQHSDRVGPGAQAYRVGMHTPHTKLRAHFHDVAQFQVFVDGSGWLGSTRLEPVSVFYTDAYASYGPIIAGANGLDFFTLRHRHDGGVHFMPESRKLRQDGPGRRSLVEVPPRSMPAQVCQRAELLRFDDGAAVERLDVGPQTGLADVFADTAPNQYVVVVTGSVVADGTVLRHGSLMYNEDVAEPNQVQTQDEPATLLILSFGAG